MPSPNPAPATTCTWPPSISTTFAPAASQMSIARAHSTWRSVPTSSSCARIRATSLSDAFSSLRSASSRSAQLATEMGAMRTQMPPPAMAVTVISNAVCAPAVKPAARKERRSPSAAVDRTSADSYSRASGGRTSHSSRPVNAAGSSPRKRANARLAATIRHVASTTIYASSNALSAASATAGAVSDFGRAAAGRARVRAMVQSVAGGGWDGRLSVQEKCRITPADSQSAAWD